MEKTDMFDAARGAQEVEREAFRLGGIKLVAPAKVNLFLDIGAKRPDGYHEAVSIMHAMLLHDVLWMRLVPGEGEGAPAVPEGASDAAGSATAPDGAEASPDAPLSIQLTTRSYERLPQLDVPTESNIVAKAIRLLAAKTGRTERECVRVHLEKHVPAQAGLGGGSSDAAAALLGAAHLWSLDPADPRIEEAARQLGADVAFFLRGGCTCLTGVGDVFDHMLAPMASPVVLVKPDGGVSTGQAYARFDADPAVISADVREAALAARRADEVPLANNLVSASEALLPELAEIREWLSAQPGVQQVLMSGSGSATFAVCDTMDAAARVSGAAQTHGWWARSTLFGPYRAAQVPAR